MLLFLEVLNETKIGLLEQLFLKKLTQVMLPHFSVVVAPQHNTLNYTSLSLEFACFLYKAHTLHRCVYTTMALRLGAVSARLQNH